MLIIGLWTRLAGSLNAAVLLLGLLTVYVRQGMLLKGTLVDAAIGRTWAGYEYVALLAAATVLVAVGGGGGGAARSDRGARLDADALRAGDRRHPALLRGARPDRPGPSRNGPSGGRRPRAARPRLRDRRQHRHVGAQHARPGRRPPRDPLGAAGPRPIGQPAGPRPLLLPALGARPPGRPRSPGTSAVPTWAGCRSAPASPPASRSSTRAASAPSSSPTPRRRRACRSSRREPGDARPEHRDHAHPGHGRDGRVRHGHESERRRAAGARPRRQGRVLRGVPPAHAGRLRQLAADAARHGPHHGRAAAARDAGHPGPPGRR